MIIQPGRRGDGLVCQIFALLLPHYLLLTTGLHTPAPPPQKGVWVFPYQRLTNTKRTFESPDQYFYLVRPLGGGHDRVLISPTSHLCLLPPLHPTAGRLQERVGMCVSFDT